jgi:hypothetical protein
MATQTSKNFAKLKSFSGFSKEQVFNWTSVEEIQDCMGRLTNDDLMMKNKNRFSLAERQDMSFKFLLDKIEYCLSHIHEKGWEDKDFDVESKLKELKSLTASI